MALPTAEILCRYNCSYQGTLIYLKLSFLSAGYNYSYLHYLYFCGALVGLELQCPRLRAMKGSWFFACFHSLTAFLITDLIPISTLFIWPQQFVAFPEKHMDHTDCFGGPFSILLLSWEEAKSVSMNEYPFMTSLKHMFQSTLSQIQNLENKRP